MEKCIIDLAAAIGNVDSDYIKVIGFKFNSEKYLQAAEHAFSAELYHQYRTIIDIDKSQYYKGLKLQFDLEKQRFGGKRPDIVLHSSPLDRKDQRLYIEVKTNLKKKAFSKDLKKLFLATDKDNEKEQLGYINAAFIVGKIAYKDIVKQINGYVVNENLETDERLQKIFLIHFLTNKKLKIKSFSELI